MGGNTRRYPVTQQGGKPTGGMPPIQMPPTFGNPSASGMLQQMPPQADPLSQYFQRRPMPPTGMMY